MPIKSFAHKGLESFFYEDNTSGINVNHANRLAMILDSIDASHHPVDLRAIYGYKFDEKKGSGKGVFTIRVNGNYRVTFQVEDEGATFLDYDDYHGKQIKSR